MLVSRLVSRTVAPGTTALCASVTRPTTRPCSTCASTTGATNRRESSAANANRAPARILFMDQFTCGEDGKALIAFQTNTKVVPFKDTCQRNLRNFDDLYRTNPEKHWNLCAIGRTY